MPETFPKALREGYRSFLGDRFEHERNRYRSLGETGQSPETLVIGCCDSRVSPEVIFDAHPGELFVIRNVANLIPPFETGGVFHGTSAALEFAVQALRVKHIVVLGHASCGGVRAYAKPQQTPLTPSDFIGHWMKMIAPAAERLAGRESEPDYLTRLELAAIENSLVNLMTFPCVSRLVERGKLKLHGAYFGVASGVLMIRDPATGDFSPAVPDMPARVPGIRAF